MNVPIPSLKAYLGTDRVRDTKANSGESHIRKSVAASEKVTLSQEAVAKLAKQEAQTQKTEGAKEVKSAPPSPPEAKSAKDKG